jgi:hypothetical protein
VSIARCESIDLDRNEFGQVKGGEVLKDLMVLTCLDQLGDTGRKIGFWLGVSRGWSKEVHRVELN